MSSTILIFTFTFCQGQSFAGLSIGTDFASIRSADKKGQGIDVYNEGYSTKSLTFALKGEHFISKDFSLGLTFGYTRKEVEAFAFTFEPVRGLRFNSFMSSFALKWHLRERWHIGAGPCLNYWYNVRNIDGGAYPYLNVKSKKEYGSTISIGHLYKNILAEVYFNKSFASYRTDITDFKPINSFGISLSYLFQVAKGRR